mmetsp:Transcript_30449/g.42014  ORF Transcript_30449/g.42014 Transcript_30449/m.42014 type:complete len:350 (+) Transcript_30449:139-1188(+)|eukprot:CAMPEP_0201476418 /NCGR_PEP_ID=MMETSP0151_2-20130828/1612_1 /ASSEMBLY_ACC=CAM_ASM_000257 /TAXON_ID=200890 /ORGANISM="Paramoeba atlantica, Strain 621/1 / CCAP 1560/9" /LENGTH=349 /DNA_ID=CAMNT_0047856767 /DNA_START=135 /DNA_END=1184 /DNA_ORIENTATION=-
MASESEETWSEESDDDKYEEEDVREILIEKMEEHDPNIFSVNFDDLEDFKKIGEGNFGRIWRGDYLGTTVAVKQLLDVDDEDMHKYIEREMLTLRQMRHPNILQMIGLCKHASGIFIVTEYISGGNLRKRLKDEGIKMPWTLRTQIALDIAQGMLFLHSRGYIHRDLKSHNLLVDENWRIKVCDFGFARCVDRGEVMTVCGTDEWMAPEVALGRHYDEQADVFSYAMVLIELITRKKPPQRQAGRAFAFDAAAFRKTCPPDAPKGLIDLACEMAEFYPDKRPNFRAALKKLKVIQKEVRDAERAAKKKAKSKRMDEDLSYMVAEVVEESAPKEQGKEAEKKASMGTHRK